MVKQWLEIGRLGDWEIGRSRVRIQQWTSDFGIRTFGHSDFLTFSSTTTLTMLQRAAKVIMPVSAGRQKKRNKENSERGTYSQTYNAGSPAVVGLEKPQEQKKIRSTLAGCLLGE